MAVTYEPIATQTLGSAVATVTFSTITGTYTDLILVTSAFSSSVTGIAVQFNSDTGNNYSVTLIDTDGTTATSNRTTNASKMQICGWSTTLGSTTKPSIAITQIMNYSNTTTNKTALTRAQNYNSGTGGSVDAMVGLWRSTAAITSITLLLDAGNFAIGSTFTLYGIKAA